MQNCSLLCIYRAWAQPLCLPTSSPSEAKQNLSLLEERNEQLVIIRLFYSPVEAPFSQLVLKWFYLSSLVFSHIKLYSAATNLHTMPYSLSLPADESLT